MYRTLFCALLASLILLPTLSAGCKRSGPADGPSVRDLQAAGPEGVKARMMEKGKASGSTDSKSAPAPTPGQQVK